MRNIWALGNEVSQIEDLNEFLLLSLYKLSDPWAGHAMYYFCEGPLEIAIC
jgi:hypothetical protein